MVLYILVILVLAGVSVYFGGKYKQTLRDLEIEQQIVGACKLSLDYISDYYYKEKYVTDRVAGCYIVAKHPLYENSVSISGFGRLVVEEDDIFTMSYKGNSRFVVPYSFTELSYEPEYPHSSHFPDVQLWVGLYYNHDTNDVISQAAEPSSVKHDNEGMDIELIFSKGDDNLIAVLGVDADGRVLFVVSEEFKSCEYPDYSSIITDDKGRMLGFKGGLYEERKRLELMDKQSEENKEVQDGELFFGGEYIYNV